MKKRMISISNQTQGKQLIPMLRLNGSLAHSTRLIPSSNTVTTTTNAHLAPNKLCLLRLSGLIFTSLALSMVLSPIANAALSATTANTIEGTRPYFELTASGQPLMDIKELLGFSYKNGATTVLIDTDDSTQVAGGAHTISIPAGVYLDELEALIPIDGATHNLQGLAGLTIKDLDGDVSGGTSAKGILQATLKVDNITTTPSHITINNCSSYELEVKIANLTTTHYPVTAYTTYGAPNDREYTGTQTVATYQLLPQGKGICIVAPFDKTVQPASGLSLGGASTEWITGKGFSVPALKAAGMDFPLTGFRNAQFDLLGSGTTQVNYSCKLANTTDSAYITLSAAAGTAALGQGCGLTYTGKKIDKAIKIDMYHNGAPATVIDSYIIPIATLWADGGGTAAQLLKYNTQGGYVSDPNAFKGDYDAANYCIGLLTGTAGTLSGLNDYKTASQSFFTRAELTNAKEATLGYMIYDGGWQNYPGTGAGAHGGSYTRTADGTFMSEWGNVNSYVSSPWSASSRYWAVGAYSTGYQYFVFSSGGIGVHPPGLTIVTSICKR